MTGKIVWTAAAVLPLFLFGHLSSTSNEKEAFDQSFKRNHFVVLCFDIHPWRGVGGEGHVKTGNSTRLGMARQCSTPHLSAEDEP